VQKIPGREGPLGLLRRSRQRSYHALIRRLRSGLALDPGSIQKHILAELGAPDAVGQLSCINPIVTPGLDNVHVRNLVLNMSPAPRQGHVDLQGLNQLFGPGI
jgi:hypothetical protein